MISRKIFHGILMLVFFMGTCLFAVMNPQSQKRNIIKRYAVAIGANEGGKDRV